MKKKRYKRKIVFFGSRNIWARRGSNLVHFLASIIITSLGYLADLIGFLLTSIWEAVVRFFKSRSAKKKKKVNEWNKVRDKNVDSVERLPKFVPEVEKPNVTFDDIYGMDVVKKEIRLRVIEPLKHPEMAEAYNLVVGGGILLHGPPGNGKTELARAIANEVDAMFFVLDVEKILGCAGAGERNLALFFKEVRMHERAIVFIDEAEGVVTSTSNSVSIVRVGVTTQFLREIDGFRSRNSKGFMIYLSASNNLGLMDEAAKSRHGVKIHVPLIEDDGRMFILHRELRNIPHSLDDGDFGRLVELTEGFSGRDVVNLANGASLRAFGRSVDSDNKQDVLPVFFGDFEEVLNVVKQG